MLYWVQGRARCKIYFGERVIIGMPQCLGRLVKDRVKGLHMLEFDQGGLFYLPIRCKRTVSNGDLCESCIGVTGRVTDPIPLSSRLYGGAWYNLKIKSGCTVSEQNMARAKKAVATACEGVEAEPKVKPRPKVVLKVVTETKPEPKPEPKPKAPVAIIPHPMQEVPVDSVREIKVKKQEVNGRSVYVGPKDKVYDLKFKYLGRLKETILDFPDSDEGM